MGSLDRAAIGVAAVAGGAMVLASQRRTLQTLPSLPRSARLICCGEQQVNADVVEQETPIAPASITITSSEPSWLSIRSSDDSELFEGTLQTAKHCPPMRI